MACNCNGKFGQDLLEDNLFDGNECGFEDNFEHAEEFFGDFRRNRCNRCRCSGRCGRCCRCDRFGRNGEEDRFDSYDRDGRFSRCCRCNQGGNCLNRQKAILLENGETELMTIEFIGNFPVYRNVDRHCCSHK